MNIIFFSNIVDAKNFDREIDMFIFYLSQKVYENKLNKFCIFLFRDWMEKK